MRGFCGWDAWLRYSARDGSAQTKALDLDLIEARLGEWFR
jgi:hypothetical protein